MVVALIACLALAILAMYQVVLLFGAPLARFAWGGEDHYLQPRFRGYAVLSVALYVIAIVAALGGANIIRVPPVLAWQIACYVFSAAFFAAFILTARSRSTTERRVMLPINVALSGMFLIVAIAGHIGS